LSALSIRILDFVLAKLRTLLASHPAARLMGSNEHNIALFALALGKQASTQAVAAGTFALLT
jgi:hypothetical protein